MNIPDKQKSKISVTNMGSQPIPFACADGSDIDPSLLMPKSSITGHSVTINTATRKLYLHDSTLKNIFMLAPELHIEFCDSK